MPPKLEQGNGRLSKPLVCYLCGQAGHIEVSCPNLEDGRFDIDGPIKVKKLRKPSRPIVCHGCGEYGHIRSQCHLRIRSVRSSVKANAVSVNVEVPMQIVSDVEVPMQIVRQDVVVKQVRDARAQVAPGKASEEAVDLASAKTDCEANCKINPVHVGLQDFLFPGRPRKSHGPSSVYRPDCITVAGKHSEKPKPRLVDGLIDDCLVKGMRFDSDSPRTIVHQTCIPARAYLLSKVVLHGWRGMEMSVHRVARVTIRLGERIHQRMKVVVAEEMDYPALLGADLHKQMQEVIVGGVVVSKLPTHYYNPYPFAPSVAVCVEDVDVRVSMTSAQQKQRQEREKVDAVESEESDCSSTPLDCICGFDDPLFEEVPSPTQVEQVVPWQEEDVVDLVPPPVGGVDSDLFCKQQHEVEYQEVCSEVVRLTGAQVVMARNEEVAVELASACSGSDPLPLVGIFNFDDALFEDVVLTEGVVDSVPTPLSVEGLMEEGPTVIPLPSLRKTSRVSLSSEHQLDPTPKAQWLLECKRKRRALKWTPVTLDELGVVEWPECKVESPSVKCVMSDQAVLSRDSVVELKDLEKLSASLTGGGETVCSDHIGMSNGGPCVVSVCSTSQTAVRGMLVPDAGVEAPLCVASVSDEWLPNSMVEEVDLVQNGLCCLRKGSNVFSEQQLGLDSHNLLGSSVAPVDVSHDGNMELTSKDECVRLAVLDRLVEVEEVVDVKFMEADVVVPARVVQSAGECVQRVALPSNMSQQMDQNPVSFKQSTKDHFLDRVVSCIVLLYSLLYVACLCFGSWIFSLVSLVQPLVCCLCRLPWHWKLLDEDSVWSIRCVTDGLATTVHDVCVSVFMCRWGEVGPAAILTKCQCCQLLGLTGWFVCFTQYGVDHLCALSDAIRKTCLVWAMLLDTLLANFMSQKNVLCQVSVDLFSLLLDVSASGVEAVPGVWCGGTERPVAVHWKWKLRMINCDVTRTHPVLCDVGFWPGFLSTPSRMFLEDDVVLSSLSPSDIAEGGGDVMLSQHPAGHPNMEAQRPP